MHSGVTRSPVAPSDRRGKGDAGTTGCSDGLITLTYPAAMAASSDLVRMEGIHKSFPGVHALDDCRFELRAGEVHALCGENGAGKSTMMKVLAGIYPKDAGRILFKGQEVEIDPIDDDQVTIFHGGTIKRGGKLVNVAGRVVSVCARSASLADALLKVYEAVPKVRFAGARPVYSEKLVWRSQGV